MTHLSVVRDEQPDPPAHHSELLRGNKKSQNPKPSRSKNSQRVMAAVWSRRRAALASGSRFKYMRETAFHPSPRFPDFWGSKTKGARLFLWKIMQPIKCCLSPLLHCSLNFLSQPATLCIFMKVTKASIVFYWYKLARVAVDTCTYTYI